MLKWEKVSKKGYFYWKNCETGQVIEKSEFNGRTSVKDGMQAVAKVIELIEDESDTTITAKDWRDAEDSIPVANLTNKEEKLLHILSCIDGNSSRFQLNYISVKDSKWYIFHDKYAKMLYAYLKDEYRLFRLQNRFNNLDFQHSDWNWIGRMAETMGCIEAMDYWDRILDWYRDNKSKVIEFDFANAKHKAKYLNLDIDEYKWFLATTHKTHGNDKFIYDEKNGWSHSFDIFNVCYNPKTKYFSMDFSLQSKKILKDEA
jgi:hypothetical protein